MSKYVVLDTPLGGKAEDYPLYEGQIDSTAALSLIDWALDNAGVPKHSDDGLPLSRNFRFEWLLRHDKERNA